nr:putative late blight resistance protein homolog R1B-14 [Ipomoea batatas]
MKVWLQAILEECETIMGIGTLKEMVREIEEVEERILMIKRGTDLDPDEGVWDTYQSAPELENEVIVRFHSDIEKIVNHLCYSHLMRSVFTILRDSNIHKFRKYVGNPVLKLQVIPLVGKGGIGKTTLAKRVYRHPITIASYHIRVWVVVSKVHNLKEMLIGILRCISPITSEIYNIDEALIAEKLSTSLKGQKSLVQTNELSIEGKVKSCNIHDRVPHEVCVKEAIDGNTLWIIKDYYAPKASHWLSCQTSHWPVTRASYGNCGPDQIHSVLCFGKDVYHSKCSSDEKPNFGMVPNLMELGIYIEGQLAPSHLGSLVHLHLLEKLKFEVVAIIGRKGSKATPIPPARPSSPVHRPVMTRSQVPGPATNLVSESDVMSDYASAKSVLEGLSLTLGYLDA